jgi:hypothetical protein
MGGAGLGGAAVCEGEVLIGVKGACSIWRCAVEAGAIAYDRFLHDCMTWRDLFDMVRWCAGGSKG